MHTLQQLCIDEIVNHFDRYFSAYSKTKDANLKRRFEFLQRVYSYQIASELHCQDLMKNDYLDFLVNKYLKVLDTEWFKDCPWETVAAKFAEVGSSIRKITIPECTERRYQDVIHHLTNLEVVSMSKSTNEILKRIAQFCHNIKEIRIQYSLEVTDEGIKSLCMDENGKSLCPKLKKLYLASTSVAEEGFKFLVQNLRSLEIFNYYFLRYIEDGFLPNVLYSLHKNDLPSLDKVEPYNFTSIDLSYVDNNLPNFCNLLKICLSLCPHLKSFSCSISNKDQLDLFHSSVELERLSLDCLLNNREEINLNNLLKLKEKLISLSVSSCSLSLSMLSKSCPRLKRLNLKNVLFENEGDIAVVFPCLESCIVDGFTYDSTTAKSISLLLRNSPKLESISFRGHDLPSSPFDSDILNCCEHCPINKVSLNLPEIDMVLARHILQNCHSLQRLALYYVSRVDERELITFSQELPNHPEIGCNHFDDYYNRNAEFYADYYEN